MSYKLLILSNERLGIQILDSKFAVEDSKSLPNYPIGTLKELVELLRKVPPGKMLSVKADALSTGNLATIRQEVGSMGLGTFHTRLSGDRRLLWIS